MSNYRTRRCWGLDGEGRDIAGRHRYVYLCAHDRQSGEVYELRNHTIGLSTAACLAFLVELPHARADILAGFFFGYDTAMILSDLSDKQKQTLHRAGFVMWQSPDRLLYYIEYHPGKSLFIGRYEKPLSRGRRPNLTTWKWHGGKHWVHIEDVGSYSGKSFVATLSDWGLLSPDMAEYVQTMKDKRGEFYKEKPADIERYCRMECALLARYVAELQGAVLSEGITPKGWHGPGAIGGALLRQHEIQRVVGDPLGPEELQHAIKSAYFGGRAENCIVGRVASICVVDLRSAYPAALSGALDGTPLADLRRGSWSHVTHYSRAYRWSLWHVKWCLPATPEHIMPFPLRQRQRIWYPASGEGWYHASLVRAALDLYPSGIEIVEGWVYLPENPDENPYQFVGELAAKRVVYKAEGDPRERVLKLALNSLYGKFAQHTLKEGSLPPFQSYFAAGYVTAATQAALLRKVYEGGYDGSDVVGFATDGLFTREPRQGEASGGLGTWEQGEELRDVYVVQPGVYYAANGKRRTRGFGAASLGYSAVENVWLHDGIAGHATYRERRFVGLGYCSGAGDYSEFGQWIEADREVIFYPDKPIIGHVVGHVVGHVGTDGADYYQLGPVVSGDVSEPYTPPSPLRADLGYTEVDALLEEWWRRDQP